MYITDVKLQNFRNLKNENVTLSPGTNVFYGNNAQGKTNFIEALFVSSMGKSFKPSKEKDIILFGEKSAEIYVSYFKNNRMQENCVFINDKKKLLINRVPIQKRIDYIGKLNVVLFTPQELSIIKEGPFHRRRFLDLCVSQLRPKYMYNLSSYNQILKQKNKILKDGETSMLDIWNEKLVEYGSVVLWYRISFINRIKPILKKIYREIAGVDEILKLAYISTLKNLENKNMEEIKNIFLEELYLNKQRETEEKTAVIGPHRDDLLFFINGKNARNFASQGQQRSIVLALKIMQTQIFYEETEEYPILLLDDIASELDEKRRNFLFEKIKDKQVVITCTNAEMLKFFDNSCYFEVTGGKIEKRG